MKRRWSRARVFSTFLVLFTLTGAVVADTICYTWNDPQCYSGESAAGACKGCGQNGTYPITDHGTHWICTTVSAGYLTCPTDTACTYTAAGNCPICGFYNIFNKTGPLAQLVDGGDCPPKGP